MDKTKLILHHFMMGLLFLAMYSCNTNDADNRGYQINVEILGLENGNAVLAKLDLETNEGSVVDSTEIENGKFTFTGKLQDPYIHTILINNSEARINLFLENNKIDIKGHINAMDSIKVSGSKEDSLFRCYSTESIFDKEAGMEIMMKYPNYVFGAFVAYYQFQTHNIQSDTMKLIINSFDDSVKKSTYYRQLVKLHKTIKQVAISQSAPNFKIPDINGDTVCLNDFRDKYLLVNFWASWCDTCRESNKKLAEVYNVFNKKGFEIINISVDKNRAHWQTAINQDSLAGTNLSELNGWGNTTNVYGVKTIPQNFLINPNGIILYKNIDIEKMIKELNKFLPNKKRVYQKSSL